VNAVLSESKQGKVNMLYNNKSSIEYFLFTEAFLSGTTLFKKLWMHYYNIKG
jgi:hypothetical protein